MANFSIDKTKDKISDVKRNLDTKKGELEQLETKKNSLLDAASDIQASNIDEETQRTVMELINESLEETSEKGAELSNEMSADFESIESMKQEAQESMESNQQERASLEQKKSLLDKMGLGGKLEESISELDSNRQELTDLTSSLAETEKELSAVSSKLDML